VISARHSGVKNVLATSLGAQWARERDKWNLPTREVTREVDLINADPTDEEPF
jgi:hypothetical protein